MRFKYILKIKNMKAISLILSSTIIFSCTSKAPENNSANISKDDYENSYKTDTVKLTPQHNEISLTGTIDFDQDKIVKVYSLVTGRINEVKVDLGAHVTKDQILADVNSPDVLNLTNDFQQDKLNLQLAEKSYSNAKELFDAKFSSEVELINAKKILESAKEELSKSSQVLKLYAGYKQQGSGSLQIKAPMDGYVVERDVNAGMDIRMDNTSPLFIISDLKTVWVMANIYEQDIAKIKIGEEVNVKTISYPDKVFKGKISNIGNTIDKDSKVLKARIAIDNTEGLLKPDMFATVIILNHSTVKQLAVNPKAIVFDNDNYFVVVKNKKSFSIKKVQVVSETSNYSFIIGDLKDGDVVISEGSLLVYNSLNL